MGLAPDERSMPVVPCQSRSRSFVPSVPFPASQSWLCIIRHERSKLNQPVEFSAQTLFAPYDDDGKDDGHGPHPRNVNPCEKSPHAIDGARRARQVDPRQVERDKQDVEETLRADRLDLALTPEDREVDERRRAHRCRRPGLSAHQKRDRPRESNEYPDTAGKNQDVGPMRQPCPRKTAAPEVLRGPLDRRAARR